MKKLLVLVFVLVLIAGCTYGDPPPRPLSFEEALELTVAQCENATLEGSRRTLLEERPDFGFSSQVLSPEELVVGEVYVFCHVPTGDATVYVLTSEPYEYNLGKSLSSLRIDVRRRDDNWPSYLFLADMGVVPYQGGKWNPANALLWVPAT